MTPSADTKIKHLHKVTLDITAGTQSGATDVIRRPHRLAFIYGIGSGGLSPFEFELADKGCGDRVQLFLRRSDIDKMFEHLARLVCHLPELQDSRSFFLNCQIAAVDAASSSEIVKAMAEGTDCGCSCCGGQA